MNTAQLLQTFHHLDALGLMHPNQFDKDAAVKKVKQVLLPNLETILGPVGTDWWLVQPIGFTLCTFHSEIQLGQKFAQAELTDGPMVMRFSCFGDLVAFQEDCAEDEHKIDPLVKQQIISVLSNHGYIYLNSDNVHTLWRDHVGLETDAWFRFFDYGKL